MTRPPPPPRAVVDDDDDESLEHEEDSSSKDIRRRPPRPSMRGIRQSMAAASIRRRRRRSSARFLHLQHPLEEAEEEEEEENEKDNSANLQELYSKAIRLNAENKINATNSWSLHLIENIDNFLLDEEEDDDMTAPSTTASMKDLNEHSASGNSGRRVNFTKASCTLDASVKIYSYRVDDVHLTSYKVLANLNRSDTNKPDTAVETSQQTDPADDSETGATTVTASRKGRARVAGSTIETHIANINLNKLDAAFDIDPLFSKMSKTFDEGGAKGLLLANLGVGPTGCNIVFDSSLAVDNEEIPDTSETLPRQDGMIDIGSLNAKINALLQDYCRESTMHDDNYESALDSLTLVPQLASLRDQYADLESAGFVCNGTPDKRKPRSRYGVSQEEEKLADRSIHQEAVERSCRSLGGRSSSSIGGAATSNMIEASPQSEFAADDYGGDFGDDDDDGFDRFISSNENRFSSISLVGSVVDSSPTSTTALLDVLSNSEGIWATGNDNSYFGKAALLGNEWAGVAHWTKSSHSAKKPIEPKKAVQSKKKNRKCGTLVDLTAASDLDRLLASSRPKKSTQLSRAVIAKHTKNENVLPMDAGCSLQTLSSLFLRPDLKRNQEAPPTTKKQVGFLDVPWPQDGSFGGFDDGDDNSDGPGFELADEDGEDFVSELEGVRRVEKVRVQYATVAKKVDVKRLKRDLWKELEAVFNSSKVVQDDDMDDLVLDDEADLNNAKTFLSFQQTVQEMEQAKSQADVTLSFYFICILHLANEKGLRLDQKGLEDFDIYHDITTDSPSF
jgi:condensin complex subunit 2